MRPRGTLPARVYWFRRGLVVAFVLGVITVAVRLVPGSGAEPPAAVKVDSPRSPATSAAPTPFGPVAPSAKPTRKATAKKTASTKKTSAARTPGPSPVPLAAPDGPCSADEITVTPTITQAIAGRPVALTLELTGTQPACNFTVSSRTLVARVTSGSDRIWSSQDCRGAVPTQTVVVRSGKPAEVTVTWDGRRSEPHCPGGTAWALPGYYHVTAAILGSEPTDQQFRLSAPPRPVVTQTASPKTKKG